MSSTTERPTRHLDIGCGAVPRNPYRRTELHGVDICASTCENWEIRMANLSVQPIPYPDNHFDSLSAYDFLEHVPRILPTADGLSTRFPFIELMNEIWRVLTPGGLFYACTPVYPHVATFVDPTHVNPLARGSHVYFTQPQLLGRMYGFSGNFEVKRVLCVKPSGVYEAENPGLSERIRRYLRERRQSSSHVIWEFIARKP
ncbi:MAG: hypothetical protein RJA44_1463 [Pseudomonadota bacterium]